MRWTLNAERNLAGIALRVGDELRERLDPERRPHDEQHRLIDADRHRPKVARRDIIERLREMLDRGDRRRAGEQQRVAIRR
jgi:hypothetical protein